MNRFAGVDVETDVPCRLRDGTVLRADVYRPDTEHHYPVLLMRQPYGKSIASTVTYAHPTWYARHGYIVVIQDVRGRGTSEGTFNPFIQEKDDGHDAVEWAAALAGSNGRIGMYGFSYQGYTQWAAAAAHPPHLTAIAPAMCAADLYNGWFYPFGRFALGGSLPWATQLARDEARRRGLSAEEERLTLIMQHPAEWLLHLPLVDVPMLAELAPFYRDWVEHCESDKYWADRNLIPDLMNGCVPALHVGGWYDPYLQGTLQTFSLLSEVESVDNRHRLMVGPWAHIPWGRKTAGVDHGPTAVPSLDQAMLDWFDHWLKDGAQSNALQSPPVRFFELGSHQWHDAAEWPVRLRRRQGNRLYLTSTGLPANGSQGGGVLSASPPTVHNAAVDVFVYDARLPMPFPTVDPMDRSDIEQRHEILVYTGEPMTDVLRLCGSPKLYVHADAINGPTDCVAVLTAVDSHGAARFLSVGRAQVPASGEADLDAVDVLKIEMRPIAAELLVGWRLRLEITGSAFPLFARHVNGVDESLLPSLPPDALGIATVSILSTAEHASVLILPCV